MRDEMDLPACTTDLVLTFGGMLQCERMRIEGRGGEGRGDLLKDN